MIRFRTEAERRAFEETGKLPDRSTLRRDAIGFAGLCLAVVFVLHVGGWAW
jgi:hypothetical protein